ncbi:hypothetical protein R3P38DRAFT_2805768 [Favolaschia claudopus]|uniref:Uncharacterized protein n=1 Tax=Favolaschia claudopus TaxID=2862362 RepID=A0AAV9ZMC3_9AGAR
MSREIVEPGSGVSDARYVYDFDPVRVSPRRSRLVALAILLCRDTIYSGVAGYARSIMKTRFTLYDLDLPLSYRCERHLKIDPAPQAADAPGYVHLYAALLLLMRFRRSFAYGAWNTLAGARRMTRMSLRMRRNLYWGEVAGRWCFTTQLFSVFLDRLVAHSSSVILSLRHQLVANMDTSPWSPVLLRASEFVPTAFPQSSGLGLFSLLFLLRTDTTRLHTIVGDFTVEG